MEVSMDETKKRGRLQFSLRGLLVLVTGVAIGLAVGVAGRNATRTRFLNLPSEAQQVLLSPHAIRPPDLLTIELVGKLSAVHPEISGEHLVAHDGTVNLGPFGRVTVAGKTIEEARRAIEQHLSKHMKSPRVTVDVSAYNSKKYYVIVQEGGRQAVHSLPMSGSETVLDAVSAVSAAGDLIDTSAKTVWIARPQGKSGGREVLRVDWEGITRRGSAASNYQIFPGDRVFVSDKRWTQ
jgi:protein involved in polysaccharide export with SLBB domain